MTQYALAHPYLTAFLVFCVLLLLSDLVQKIPSKRKDEES